MTTFYAALGDVDAKPETDTDTRAEEILTDALDEYTLDIHGVDVYSAQDRCMARVEFTVGGDDQAQNDEELTAETLSRLAGHAIGITTTAEAAKDALDALRPYPRECLASLSVRGLSPRAASCTRK